MRQLINRKRFILENIETLLDTHLSPACIDETLKQQPLPELMDMLQNDSRNAIYLLKCFQYEIPTLEFQQLCQHNYSDLFRMKDRLTLHQASPDYKCMSEDALAFYELLMPAINRVEAFLVSLGIGSLAPHEQLPDHYLECRKAMLQPTCLLLLSKCKSNHVDAGLTELLRLHFHAFNTSSRMLQHELCFTEELISSLVNLFDKPQEDDYNTLIMNELVSLNFNSGEVISYFRRHIKADMEQSNGSKRKFQTLNWQLKEIKQLQPMSGLALKPTYPELKGLLLEILQSEIRYLELSLHVPENVVQPLKTKGKIRLQLSQRIFAMLIHTMISMELIQLENLKEKREFTAFLADNFTTAGSEDIEPEYFRRRYREKHTAASETLVALLEKMILFVKREYMEV